MDQPAIYSETVCEKVMGVSAFGVRRGRGRGGLKTGVPRFSPYKSTNRINLSHCLLY
jgi:hypothetical protein